MKSNRVSNGYKLIYLPSHSRAMTSKNWNGYVYEHVVVAEEKIGRSLRDDEEVHHLDLDRSNNTPSNIIVLEKSQHVALHNWISRGAPMVKAIGANGVNSGKAKGFTPYCKNQSCNKVIHGKRLKYCSRDCWVLDISSNIPSPEQLGEDLKTMNLSQIGRKYGVSGNAVKKWINKYNLSQS